MSMTQAELSYYYHFSMYPDNLVKFAFREFLDHGIDRFVFSDSMITRCLKEPAYLDFLRDLTKKLGVKLVSMHAPFGGEYDLNIPVPERRTGMISDHVRAMEIAAEFGSKTYTIHVGAYHYCSCGAELPVLRKYALEALEQLVPAAEKNGLVLAVENSFEPPNSAREVLDLITPFLSSPAIGVCYDTGHANVMASAPGKKLENYPDWLTGKNWRNNFVYEDNALDLLRDHIVTTHIHDNSGYTDHHGMPGDGTIDWKTLIPELKACPRMLEYQTEVTMLDGVNWAGTLLAPPGGYSVKRLVETFRNLGF